MASICRARTPRREAPPSLILALALTDIQKLTDKFSLFVAPDDGRRRVTHAIVANEGPIFWVKRQLVFVATLILWRLEPITEKGTAVIPHEYPAVMDGSSRTFARS